MGIAGIRGNQGNRQKDQKTIRRRVWMSAGFAILLVWSIVLNSKMLSRD